MESLVVIGVIVAFYYFKKKFKLDVKLDRLTNILIIPAFIVTVYLIIFKR